MTIAVAGAGAFGSALACALALDGKAVTLWARDQKAAADMAKTRQVARLPGVELPSEVTPTADINDLAAADIILVAVPAQALRGFLETYSAQLAGKRLVACCKGIDMTSMTGPSESIASIVPGAVPAVLTGPSFAADIARGLPTALTLACADDAQGEILQQALSTPSLRLYRTTDVAGADMGGALKNVMAIACGACIGAGFGDSARAALMTRGFAEMQRFAQLVNARPETLMGLSGLGDLALTCTSDMSRNYRYGFALGQSKPFSSDTTVEGAKTAIAVSNIAKNKQIDLPISTAVAALVTGQIDVRQAMSQLLSRPLKEE